MVAALAEEAGKISARSGSQLMHFPLLPPPEMR